ncbi:MAG: gamma subclass chorismate mutase AroQ [Pseudomonadota bacterium]
MKRLLLICLAVVPWTCVSPSRADGTDELFRLINQRLALMQAVAAYKWQTDTPIQDLAREQVVLDQAATSALETGLVPATTREFFQTQIEAAKEIQRYWFEIYAAGNPPVSAPDLDAEVRPQLLLLGDSITRALGKSRPVSTADLPAYRAAILTPGLSEQTAQALFLALTRVQRFDHRLAQVLETGILRVGTTGDYAPFSRATDNNTFEGIDIDLAHDLAAALGARIQFFQTSWPTLMQDLAAGKFDVGMSGISRNTARQKVAFFSPAYYRGGKTPIIRCEDRAKFTSLAEINQPGVRVIVNPGGTNQAFVQENINAAAVRVFDDNTTIFDEIANHRADVMITDAIEVKLKTAEIPTLCAAMPGQTLTYLEKAYLLPQDIYLQAFVSTWLELRMADGTVSRTISRHLPTGPAR